MQPIWDPDAGYLAPKWPLACLNYESFRQPRKAAGSQCKGDSIPHPPNRGRGFACARDRGTGRRDRRKRWAQKGRFWRHPRTAFARLAAAWAPPQLASSTREQGRGLARTRWRWQRVGTSRVASRLGGTTAPAGGALSALACRAHLRVTCAPARLGSDGRGPSLLACGISNTVLLRGLGPVLPAHI